MPHFLNLFKPKLFVLRLGTYKRVTGPADLLESLKGLGGYIVLGDRVVVSSGLYYDGTNSTINGSSINGYRISQMALADVTAKEDDMLRKPDRKDDE